MSCYSRGILFHVSDSPLLRQVSVFKHSSGYVASMPNLPCFPALTPSPSQFGFDGGSVWKQRRDELFDILHTNPRAKFVTRAVQFGSEPLFDGVLPPTTLAAQIQQAKNDLAAMDIPVTISEMAYGFQMNGAAGLRSLMGTIDQINAHVLPFFGQSASTGACPFSPRATSVALRCTGLVLTEDR